MLEVQCCLRSSLWGRCRRSWGGGGRWGPLPGTPLRPDADMSRRIFIFSPRKNLKWVLFEGFLLLTDLCSRCLCYLYLTSIFLDSIGKVGEAWKWWGEGEGVGGRRSRRADETGDNCFLSCSEERTGEPCRQGSRVTFGWSDYNAICKVCLKWSVRSRMANVVKRFNVWRFILIVWLF